MKPAFSVCTALLLTAASAPSAALATGYYYEAGTRVEGAGARHDSTVLGWVDGANAKIQFREQDQTGFFSPGSYLLTTDGGATLYLVNPEERTYSEMDLEGMLGMVGELMNAMGGVMRMELADMSNEKVSEAAGESILGYPTRHHHYKSAYTMRMSVLGFRNEMRNESEHHIWCTQGFDAAGFGVWLRPDRFRTGHEEFDKLIANEYADLDCLPLRMRVEQTTTGQRGRTSTSTTTTEVTVLREETAPSGTFELPADYELVPLMSFVPEDLREGLHQDAESDPQPEERERPMRRLRDLLR